MNIKVGDFVGVVEGEYREYGSEVDSIRFGKVVQVSKDPYSRTLLVHTGGYLVGFALCNVYSESEVKVWIDGDAQNPLASAFTIDTLHSYLTGLKKGDD